MKRLFFAAAGLLAAAVVAHAAPYAAKAFRTYGITKTLTYKMTGKRALTVQSTAATSVYLNGKGDDWAMAAGSIHDFYPFANISTLKFTCASTAAASPVKIRIQEGM